MATPLSLNATNGFVLNQFWTDTAYDTYIGNTDKYTYNNHNICHRFIASGGTPPYIYTLIGNTPPEIGLHNYPRLSGSYDEYADLTIISPVTFPSNLAGEKSVAVKVTDSAGASLTVTGSVIINLKQTLPVKVSIVPQSTATLAVFQDTVFIPENTKLRLPTGTFLPRWAYYIPHRTMFLLEIHATGSFKSRRPIMKVSGKQRALSFEQIGQPEGATTLKWKLYGLVEGSRRDSFEDMTIIFKDGDDVYPPIDLMCVVQADPTL